jgi:hypothetical protein
MYSTIIDMSGCASNQPVEPCSFNFACVGSGARNHHLAPSTRMLQCAKLVSTLVQSNVCCCVNNVKQMTAASMPRPVHGIEQPINE